jgi:hypothetical protein
MVEPATNPANKRITHGRFLTRTFQAILPLPDEHHSKDISASKLISCQPSFSAD